MRNTIEIVQFTAEQFDAYRNMIFFLGLGIGCAVGGCVTMIASVILGRFDDDEDE